MFGRKVECDACNTKLKPKEAVFHRGSYFCDVRCKAVWEISNPPRVARGEPADLRHNLIHTIDAALDEYQQGQGSIIGDLATRMIPLVGHTNADLDAKVRSEHISRFAEYTHECIPIARALGYAEEVAVLETFGFGGDIRNVIVALQRTRARAAA